jgi:hypothetical protein
VHARRAHYAIAVGVVLTDLFQQAGIVLRTCTGRTTCPCMEAATRDLQAPAHQLDRVLATVASDRLVPQDDSLAKNAAASRKIPLLLHPRQFHFQRQQSLIASYAVAGKGLVAGALHLTAPAEHLVRADADVPGNMADVSSRLPGQRHGFTLELFAVLLAVCHDTPPAPSWGLTEVSALVG